MTLVSIDVPAARGAASDIASLASTATSQGSAVTQAASRADASAPSMSRVGELALQLEDMAEGLNARVDLAIIVNGGDEGALTNGPVTYDVPSDTTDAVKAELGKRMAEFGADLEGRAGDDEELDRIEDLNERMQAWLDDEAVMSAMYDELGPDGTLDLIAAVGAAGHGVHERVMPLAESLRAGMAKASGAMTDEEARDWGRQLADFAGRPGLDDRGTDYEGTDQALALSFLADSSALDADLLTGIADGVDELERSGEFMDGGWRMRSNLAMSALWQGFPEDRQEGAFDPMTSVFRSLAEHPTEALAWFDDQDRQEYWLEKRAWGHDDLRAVAAVVDAASTDLDNIDPDRATMAEREAAARLASAVVSYLPRNGSFYQEEVGDFAWIDGEIEWHGVGAGGSLAHILSTYMPSVHTSITTDSSSRDPQAVRTQDAFGNTIEPVPYFNREGLEEIIRIASRSDEGFAELRSGVSAYTNGMIAQAAQDPSGGTMNEVLTRGARLEGLMAFHVGGGDIDLAQSRDARNQAWLDLGSDLAGAIPVPGGDAVGFVVDQGLSVTADQVSGAITGNESAARQDAEQMAQQSLDAYYRSAAWALDDAGSLPFNRDGGPADTLGTRDGEVLRPSDVTSPPLSEAERDAALRELTEFARGQHGVGGLVEGGSAIIDATYENEFSSYFD